MPSETFSESAVDPQATVDEFLHWALSTTTHLAIGVILGGLLARTMRARHLHWSWAALAAVVAVLARQALGGAALTLVVATTIAAIRGRRWHREDIDAGSDLAEIARHRAHPLELVRSLAWAAATRIRERVNAAGRRRGEALAIGVDEHRRTVSIPLGGTGGGNHTLVVGATGSGKTVTQTSIATHAIERGRARS